MSEPLRESLLDCFKALSMRVSRIDQMEGCSNLSLLVCLLKTTLITELN
jgi:hypothetical protein